MSGECGHTAQEHAAQMTAHQDQLRARFTQAITTFKWPESVNAKSLFAVVADLLALDGTIDPDEPWWADRVADWSPETLHAGAHLAGRAALALGLTPGDMEQKWIDSGYTAVGLVIAPFMLGFVLNERQVLLVHRLASTLSLAERVGVADELQACLGAMAFTPDQVRALIP